MLYLVKKHSPDFQYKNRLTGKSTGKPIIAYLSQKEKQNLHHCRQHQCAEGQGDDAEQGRQDDRPGGIPLIVVELHGEDRGDGCGWAALEQKHDLRRHAVEAQQSENGDADRRNEQHSDTSKFPDVFIADDALQITGGDEHTSDEHRERRVHAAEQVDGLCDEIRHRDLKQINRKADDHRIDGRGTGEGLRDFLRELPLTML